MAKLQFRIPGEMYLLMAAMIWGGAFVAQSLGADDVSPMTFNAARSFVGALAIVPAFLWADRARGERPKQSRDQKTLLIAGIICGCLLSLAVNLQQFGISYVDAGLSGDEIAAAEKANVGKVGFLTTLYIVLVPIIGMAFRRKPGLFVWLGVGLALIGMYLLCVKGGFAISRGDISVLLCAVAFALQILAVDRFAPIVDCLRLSCLQFLVCGVISAAGMFLFETPSLKSILSAWAPILYTGVMSSGVAYTFQILGQRSCKPAVASLLMSLESVFSAVFGFLILGQTLTAREGVGCALMFAAVLLAQIKPARDGRR